ncbi:hypothetical protein B7H23_12350 [Notoacmeibacter marinus]|uniref:Cytochrome c domain-containing protein n=1 Tax=Notoacmeibacter marinus TaxID=1876515 RepID=A0A231USV8_9HYPH|nr:c-type cytochrome [Notoacmeibacter marinus]OXS98999.1 hypothetical protein B7H23_12350 [Notoacmeibacter marinus]
MSRFPKSLIAVSLMGGMGLTAPSALAQDAANGETIFKRCAGCHTVGPNAQSRVGPHLNGIVERPAAAIEDFRYSRGMKKAADDGLVWTRDDLAEYLAAPRKKIKGTRMAFAGLRKESEIADIIAYLDRFGPDGAEKTSTAEEIAAANEPNPGMAGKEPAANDVKGDSKPATESSSAVAPAPKVEEADGAGESVDAAAETDDDRQVALAAAPPSGGPMNLGRPALPAEIAAWDIDVRPDGKGLPIGSGTVAEGEAIFDEKCASCHGAFGEGAGRWPMLAGGQGTLKDERPVKTIGSYWPYLSTVYDYVHRAMPFGSSRSLGEDETYALVAYILYLNDLVDDDFELSNENFTGIEMPNADGFKPDDRQSEPQNTSDAAAEVCMTDCKESPAEITMRARVLDVTPDTADDDGDENLGAGAID